MGCRSAGSCDDVNAVERAIRRIDRTQQRFTPTAFVFGVVKKFGDDNGGVLVANLTYTAFTTLFPLLLVFTTILGLVAAINPGFRQAATDAVANQFPIIGHTLTTQVGQLKRSSLIGLIIGLAVTIWGSMGLAQAGLYTMGKVWNLPGPERPGYLPRLVRSVLFLVLLAVDVLLTTALASLSTYGHRPLALLAFAETVAATVNAGMFFAGFRILTPKVVPARDLVRGAVIAGILWTVLQVLGTYLVHHFLHSDSVYGTLFAPVLGLVAWMYLAARITVYCAEINVVFARRLWPRSIIQPPLTEADRTSLALQSLESQQRAEQQVHVTFQDAELPAAASPAARMAPDDQSAPGAPDPPDRPKANRQSP
jgi:YihY family inner membrane protein